MRKLLQNKAVVAGLVVAAGLFVAWDFIKPKRAAVPVAARVPEPGAAASGANPAAAIAVPRPLSVRSNLLTWKETFLATTNFYDPFAGAVEVVARTATGTNAVALPFVVQAISVVPGKALAVVDGRVVAEGDHLGRFVIDEIQPTKLFLRDGTERPVLTLAATTAAPRKNASAIPRPADEAGGTVASNAVPSLR